MRLVLLAAAVANGEEGGERRPFSPGPCSRSIREQHVPCLLELEFSLLINDPHLLQGRGL